MLASDRDWPAEMTDLVSIPYLQGVVVGANDGRMIVFSRAVTTGRVEVRLELSFDPNDRPARRRSRAAVRPTARAHSAFRIDGNWPRGDRGRRVVDWRASGRLFARFDSAHSRSGRGP